MQSISQCQYHAQCMVHFYEVTKCHQLRRWIQDQLVNHREDVWLDGVEDYIEHAKNLLMEAADSDSPVSGLKGEKLQAWMNGQKAEAKTQSFANTTSAASGKVLGLQSLKAQASKPHKEASLAAAGQFAFPSFPAPSGDGTVLEIFNRCLPLKLLKLTLYSHFRPDVPALVFRLNMLRAEAGVQ